ncbi:ribonuclease HI family protein, partial [bacterium]|nr:ribonuclease HI family protein [bacterium]
MNRFKKFIIKVTEGEDFDEAAEKAGYRSLEEPRKRLLELVDGINKFISESDIDSKKVQKGPPEISGQKPVFLDIYCDGASRGNPGPSSAAAVAYLPSGKMLMSRTKRLGRTTNNVAEYQALILGLTLARDIGVKKVYFKLDSQLVVKQLTGEYRIKDDKLKILAQQVKGLELFFEECR